MASESQTSSSLGGQTSRRTLKLTGLLQTERYRKKRQVLLDVDLERDSGLSLRFVQKGAVVVEQANLASFNVSLDELRKKETPATEAEPMELLDNEVDWLSEELLTKPVSALGLPASVMIRLQGTEIATVGDLVQKSEKELLALPKFDHIHFAHLNDRLNHFGLSLAEPRSKKQLGRFEIHSRIAEQDPEKRLTDEEAAQILGEIFPLFKEYRTTTDPARRLELRNQITEANIGLAKHWAFFSIPAAMSRRDPAYDADDLIQEGVIGLMRSVASFDYVLGYKFSSYASPAIRQAISRFIDYMSDLTYGIQEKIAKILKVAKRLEIRLGHFPSVETLARAIHREPEYVQSLLDAYYAFYFHPISLETPVKDDSSDSCKTLGETIGYDPWPETEERQELADLKETVAQLLQRTPLLEIERRIIELRFGLKDGEAKTLGEVGDVIGVTRERIRQIEEAALEKLRTVKTWEFIKGFRHRLQEPLLPEHVANWKKTFDCLEHILNQPRAGWSLADYLQAVCSFCGVKPEEVQVYYPNDEAMRARVTAVVLFRLLGRLTYEQICYELAIQPFSKAQTYVKRFLCYIAYLGREDLLEKLEQSRAIRTAIREETEKILSTFDNQPSPESADQVLKEVASRFSLTVEQLLAPTRIKEIVEPRKIAIFRLRQELGMSFPAIARFLGFKDHTTIMHHYSGVKDRLGGAKEGEQR